MERRGQYLRPWDNGTVDYAVAVLARFCGLRRKMESEPAIPGFNCVYIVKHGTKRK
jgi:hypothetical protein